MVKADRNLPYPLGSTVYPDGVNFAIYSENAASVTLEIYGKAGDSTPRESIPLTERTNFVWHTFVSGLREGELYGYRVDGPYAPDLGFRFNRNKLLLDPYARAITGPIIWNDTIFAYDLGNPSGDLSFSTKDNAEFMPKCVIASDSFDWKGDERPRHPWSETVIYETHVKGITYTKPDVPQDLRGTYSGLVSDTMISYLKDLGITAVELMPIHHKVDSLHLVSNNLSNYWGYNTIGYFSPDSRYSSLKFPGAQIRDFKEMVRKLHENDIEVILDVVYNHTGEGNEMGPTISFRGIDNTTYYRLDQSNPRKYVDFTGTGNSMNARHPQVLQLIMDSLRYWIQEMHVDGFRFDLAATLARQLQEVDRLSSFFEIIHQDPLISKVKLIAEPWDLGPGGYQIGQFPLLWAEWNGKYRDSVRRYWNRGDGIGEFATRISGSPDLYSPLGKTPHASINYVTSHDGFTLNDLVSYSMKHNEANLENNQDGNNDEISDNMGVEGPTDDPEIAEMRSRRMRSMIITLISSQGVPMLLGGDEIMRTSLGNNNAYCQDNEVSWYNWNLDQRAQNFLSFTKLALNLRQKHHLLRRKDFFQGTVDDEYGIKDVIWLRPDGNELSMEDWISHRTSAFAVLLPFTAPDNQKNVTPENSVHDLLLLFNPGKVPVEFKTPSSWIYREILIDSEQDHLQRFPIRMEWNVITIPPSGSAIISGNR
jgi:isoamylase